MIPNTGVLGPIREVLSPHKVAVLLFIEKYARIGLKNSEGFAQGKVCCNLCLLTIYVYLLLLYLNYYLQYHLVLLKFFVFTK